MITRQDVLDMLDEFPTANEFHVTVLCEGVRVEATEFIEAVPSADGPVMCFDGELKDQDD